MANVRHVTRADLCVVRVRDLHLADEGPVLQGDNLDHPVTEAEHQEAIGEDLHAVNSHMTSSGQEDTLMTVKVQDMDITRCFRKNYMISVKSYYHQVMKSLLSPVTREARG